MVGVGFGGEKLFKKIAWMLLQPLAVLSCFDDGLAFFEGC